MKTESKYVLCREVSGELQNVIDAEATPAVQLTDVVASMRELAFVVETVAHLQGKEKELLPATERARKIIAILSGEC